MLNDDRIFSQNEVRQLAAVTEEMQVNDEQCTMYLRQQGHHALHHRQAGFEQGARQFAQAARDQTRQAFEKSTAHRHSGAVSELPKVKQMVGQSVSEHQNASVRSEEQRGGKSCGRSKERVGTLKLHKKFAFVMNKLCMKFVLVVT